MENILYDISGSWTFSNLGGYIIVIVFSVILSFIISKQIKDRLIRLAILFLLPSTSFILFFALYPIYESDVFNDYRTIEKIESNEFQQGRLSVITIPGCGYCKESIETLKQVLDRGPIDSVYYIVSSSDSDDLASYKDMASDQFIFSLAQDTELIQYVADYSFPCFVYREGNKLYTWSNNGFGNRAKDFIAKKMDAK